MVIPRRRDRQDHDAGLAREVAGSDAPSSFFIDGKAPTDAQFPINRYSGLSVGVPGHAVRVVVHAAQLRHVLASPRRSSTARRSRTNGFRVDKTFFDQTAPNAPYFDDIPITAAIYLDTDGTPHDIGTKIRNPDLAKTYKRIGRHGVSKGFYSGAVADAIVKAASRTSRSAPPPTTRGARA